MSSNSVESRHLLLRATLITTVLLAAQAESTAASDAKPGYDIARAIADLAKINGEVDAQDLSHYLRLPNLQRDLTWQGPLSESDASNFSAIYAPPNSDLGIAKVYLTRRTGGSAVLPGKPAEFHSLSLFLKPGSCPEESTLTDAIGSKATKTRMPGYDGGPSYMATTFFVPQSHGEPVHITFVGENTCNVTISHSRPL
jgi:hypothetical protein